MPVYDTSFRWIGADKFSSKFPDVPLFFSRETADFFYSLVWFGFASLNFICVLVLKMIVFFVCVFPPPLSLPSSKRGANLMQFFVIM